MPILRKYMVKVIEIPITEKPTTPVQKHLAKAVEELEYAKAYLVEGKHGEVIRSIRNAIMNHLLTRVEEIKKADGSKQKRRFLDEGIKEALLANIPEEARRDYEAVLDGIQKRLRSLLNDHLSKFIHLDTGKLIRMPLKEDAEYLFTTTLSLVRYLASLSTGG